MKVLDLSHLTTEEILSLNEVAQEIRNPFNDLIAQLSKGKEDNIDWTVSSLASRSMYVSSLFFNCIKLELVRRLIEKGNIPDKIIVDSIAMKRVLEDYLSKNDLSAAVSCSISAISRLKRRIVPILRWFLKLYQFMWQYFFWHHKDNTLNPTNSSITLLETFNLENNFRDNNYMDRYYPGIWDYINGNEKKEFYYLPTFYEVKNYRKVYEDIKNSNQQFIIKEKFLHIKDYFYALCHPLRVLHFEFSNSEFLAFNVKALVEEDVRLYACNGLSMMAILNYLFVKRLKEKGIKVRLLIDWFENQLIDRGLDAGFRKFYPETWITGYQGFIVPPLIYMKPTELERKNGVIPHGIAVVGQGLVEPMREFCPNLNVEVAPALRFKNIWRERVLFPEGNVFCILIALPIGLRDGNEILSLVSTLLNNNELFNCRIMIKPHPTNNPEKIKTFFGENWPDNFKFVTGDFGDCVESSHLLISNTSSACLETLAKGIPVVIVGSQSGLTQNPIPPNITSDIWKLCYTAEEMGKAIEFYKNRNEATMRRHKIAGEEIKKAYFEPVNRESVRRFLKLED